jgi:hypothetical protein
VNDGYHNAQFGHRPVAVLLVLCQSLIMGFDVEVHGGENVADRSAIFAFGSQSEPRQSGDSPADATADASLSADQRFLAGLRQRRLLGLAETYCKERLSDPSLAPRRRAELAVELVRTYALAALDSKPNGRPLWWDRAHQVAIDFPQREATNPFAILVQFEDARVWISQGEVARAESQWDQAAETSTAVPRAALRNALRALDRLDTRLAVASRRHGHGHEADDALSRAAIDALQRHVAYQTARALRSQGQCYAAGTPDRTNSLQQALERLTPLAELPVADRLIWQSRVDRVACYRLLGNAAQAGRLVTAILTSNPPPEVADAARAERIRAELAAGQIDRALAAAEAAATTTGPKGADLELARLEAMIAAWRKAKGQADAAAAGRLAREAADQVQRIEERLSPYWMRRAETMLAHAMASGGVDLRALTRAAQGFYRSGKLTQAEVTYDRIAQLAADQGRTGQAFDAAFTAATIEHDLAERGSDTADPLPHHRSAIDRYGKLAETFSDHPRAAEADLLAIYHAAQIARLLTGTRRQDALDHYATRIDIHLKRWPDGSTVGQVQLWLGRLRQAQRHWEDAIAAYLAIPPDDAHFEAAVQAVVRCYDQWHAERVAGGEDARSVTRAATACYRQLLGGPQPPRGAARRDCALALAMTLLEEGDNGCGEAQQVLTAALAEPSPPSGNWQRQAQTLLVLALAGQGQAAAAREVLDQVPEGPAEPMITLIERLTQRARGLPEGSDRRAVADLAVRAAESVPADGIGLQADLARRFRTAQAAALAAAGRRQMAIRNYDGLAGRYPKDVAVQQSLAELLSNSQDPRELQRALKKWRTVQQLSLVASRRWFLARYGQAEILARQGEKAKAAKLIEVTQVLHPSLGGPVIRQKFQQLLERCQQGPVE